MHPFWAHTPTIIALTPVYSPRCRVFALGRIRWLGRRRGLCLHCARLHMHRSRWPRSCWGTARPRSRTGVQADLVTLVRTVSAASAMRRVPEVQAARGLYFPAAVAVVPAPRAAMAVKAAAPTAAPARRRPAATAARGVSLRQVAVLAAAAAAVPSARSRAARSTAKSWWAVRAAPAALLIVLQAC